MSIKADNFINDFMNDFMNDLEAFSDNDQDKIIIMVIDKSIALRKARIKEIMDKLAELTKN